MHFSPLSFGITALFILATAAAESGHVDVGVAPLPHKSTHSNLEHHHHNGGRENYHRHRLINDQLHSLTQYMQHELNHRAVISPATQRTVGKMLLGTLFRRAPTKAHNAPSKKGSVKVSSSNTAQLEQQIRSIIAKVGSAGNDFQALQKEYTWMGTGAIAQKSARIRSLFQDLMSAYQKLEAALSSAHSSYRGTESKNKALWGRGLVSRSFWTGNGNHDIYRRGNTIKVNPAQLEAQIHAVSAKVDEAMREQQSLERQLGALGWAGNAATAMRALNQRIDTDFTQLRELLHQLNPPNTNYRSAEGRTKALWGRSS